MESSTGSWEVSAFPNSATSGTDMTPELPKSHGSTLNNTENRAQSYMFGHRCILQLQCAAWMAALLSHQLHPKVKDMGTRWLPGHRGPRAAKASFPKVWQQGASTKIIQFGVIWGFFTSLKEICIILGEKN